LHPPDSKKLRLAVLVRLQLAPANILKQLARTKYRAFLMSPTESPPCKAREILKTRLRADLKVYADSVQTLQRSLGKSFAKAQRDAERARLAFETASKKLADHVATHGCG
jgi:hypothetical protein